MHKLLGGFAIPLLLCGCATNKELTSIAGGESRVFEAPPYEIRGKTRYDQNWIDNTVEGGVAAFGWPRPAERPPEIEKNLPVVAKPVVKRPGLLKRLKARVTGTPQPAVSPWPAAPVAPFAIPLESPRTAAAPPQKPRDAVDELLSPADPPPPARQIR